MFTSLTTCKPKIKMNAKQNNALHYIKLLEHGALYNDITSARIIDNLKDKANPFAETLGFENFDFTNIRGLWDNHRSAIQALTDLYWYHARDYTYLELEKMFTLLKNCNGITQDSVDGCVINNIIKCRKRNLTKNDVVMYNYFKETRRDLFKIKDVQIVFYTLISNPLSGLNFITEIFSFSDPMIFTRLYEGNLLFFYAFNWAHLSAVEYLLNTCYDEMNIFMLENTNIRTPLDLPIARVDAELFECQRNKLISGHEQTFQIDKTKTNKNVYLINHVLNEIMTPISLRRIDYDDSYEKIQSIAKFLCATRESILNNILKRQAILVQLFPKDLGLVCNSYLCY